MTENTPTVSPRRGITAPQGFRAAGIHCGIKKPGLLDLALVVSEQSGPIAGVFTRNQVVAAPVTVDRLHLRRGIGRAILVNSGNANACTGAKGLAAAKQTAREVARHLSIPSHHVFIGSTGVIGRALPVDRIVKGIICAKDFIGSIASSEPHAALAAANITRTVSRPSRCFRMMQLPLLREIRFLRAKRQSLSYDCRRLPSILANYSRSAEGPEQVPPSPFVRADTPGPS